MSKKLLFLLGLCYNSGMNSVIEKLPNDQAQLREMVALLADEKERLLAEKTRLESSCKRSEFQIRLLEDEVAVLRAKLFGPRSEKIYLNSVMPGQGSLFEVIG
ncbi:MAG: hypothetical protein JXO49_09850, partial [Deltaproteobacteria bacterium]|nr:hypothetical protein [Deltaproteobacteria bacterium]